MMSFFGDLRHTPAATKPPGPAAAEPLLNLSNVHTRMDTLQKFLSNSVKSNTLIAKDQMDMVSAEITSAIHQIIVNGAALLENNPVKNQAIIDQSSDISMVIENKVQEGSDHDCEILELDAVELLAEHVHFCEICGKGFKRDANLRMHMRAHGNQFKTPEALLAKPCVDLKEIIRRNTRFSCPFVGCNRNKQHKKFRPLKSVICVKNHFKRSHCPKMYSCTRCNNKSFSVVADLKSHMKHCGETKWKCSCGTSFSRKDKLFGHMALFEGHMPAIMEEEKGKEVALMLDDEEEDSDLKDVELVGNGGALDNGFFEGLLDGFGSIDNYCFQDLLGSPNANGLGTGMDG